MLRINAIKAVATISSIRLKPPARVGCEGAVLWVVRIVNLIAENLTEPGRCVGKDQVGLTDSSLTDQTARVNRRLSIAKAIYPLEI